MQISFDTATGSLEEARGIVALIRAIWPEAVGDNFTWTAVVRETPQATVESRVENMREFFKGRGYSDAQVQGIEASLRAETALSAADAFAEPAALPPEVAFASPPAPEVGASSASPPVPGVSLAELDSSGLPWDGRIHAGGKGKTQSGEWRKRKGLPEGEFEFISGELRKLMGLPTVSPAQAAQTAMLAEVQAPPVPQPPVPSAIPQPPAMSASATPVVAALPDPPASFPVPSPAVDPAPITAAQAFTDFMRLVTPAQTAGKLTVVDLQGAIEAVGLKQVRELLQRPDLIPAVRATVEAVIAS